MVNQAREVEELLTRKLQEANLAKIIRSDKSQFLDMEDYVCPPRVSRGRRK